MATVTDMMVIIKKKKEWNASWASLDGVCCMCTS